MLARDENKSMSLPILSRFCTWQAIKRGLTQANQCRLQRMDRVQGYGSAIWVNKEWYNGKKITQMCMRSMIKYANAHMQEKLSSFKSKFRMELVSRTMPISSKQASFKKSFQGSKHASFFKRCSSYLICLTRVPNSVQTSVLYKAMLHMQVNATYML